MHVREIVAAILIGKGLDPADRALADLTAKRMRFVLLLHKRKGIIRLGVAAGAELSVDAGGEVADGRKPAVANGRPPASPV
jgi:hypothetical protein